MRVKAIVAACAVIVCACGGEVGGPNTGKDAANDTTASSGDSSDSASNLQTSSADQSAHGACGNGKLDAGETCDGDCPVSCDDNNACTVDTITGAAHTCDLQCVHTDLATPRCQVTPGAAQFDFVPSPDWDRYSATKSEYAFAVPVYHTLTVRLWGAGAVYATMGGAPPTPYASTFGSLSAGSGSTVTPGVATGGDVNIDGDPGYCPPESPTGSVVDPNLNVERGGNAPNGGAGATAAPAPGGVAGQTPGGGAVCYASGAYVEKTFAAGELAVGSTIDIVVAGNGGVTPPTNVARTAGAGQVDVSWE